MHSTSVRLDAQTRARLQRIANQDDRSLAYVIKKAIAEYLDRHEPKEQAHD
jgi:predicted transcriptional regulator